MRGTRGRFVRGGRRVGNTPADAGNSSPTRASSTHIGKHPRRCGELSTSGMTSETISETPPQMRGTRQTRCRWTLVARNTPADAGNSGAPAGDDFGFEETPPQMRGTPHQESDGHLRLGNTPADAGNSAIYRISTQSNHYILRYSHIPGFRSNLYH